MATFPIRVGRHIAETPARLGAMAREDARSGGGLVPGRRVSEWIAELVRDGALDERSALGLCAALIRQPDAGTLAEGARLAMALGNPELGPLILHALDGHDTGILLEPDPAEPTRSVEDALLRAATVLADLADPAIRHRLVVRLRNTALRAEEARVIATWATADEIAAWLPALLVEGFPAEAREALDARLATGNDGARALAEVLGASAANPR